MMIEAARLSITCLKICRVARRSLTAIGIEVWRASVASASSSLKRIGSSSQAMSKGFSASAMRSAGGSVHRPWSSTMISMRLPTASRIFAEGDERRLELRPRKAGSHRGFGGDVEGPDLHRPDALGEQALRQTAGVETPGEQVVLRRLGGVLRRQSRQSSFRSNSAWRLVARAWRGPAQVL